jgi:hypothetical protein
MTYKLAIVDACGYETGDLTGSIYVYYLNSDEKEKYEKSNDTLKFYNNHLKNRDPDEIRSEDLDSILSV